MSDIAIRVENLSKQYRIGQREAAYKTLRESVMKLFSRRDGKTDSIWALKDVSFEVECGQVVGIIGHNGAGKTTLLKILSRVTEPTEGRVYISGRVGSLLEVGTGFHPELTGRENIFLNGAILGMRKTEIERQFDEIVAFAEIEKFIDTPVKRYSSGMYIRLAFAVAAHLKPEILLVDEVLAVGDARFQKKCLGKMGNVAESGRTVLFVSHNLRAVSNLCQRTILLQDGAVAAIGWTDEIVSSYLQQVANNIGYASAVIQSPEDPTKLAQITRVCILDGSSTPSLQHNLLEPFTVEVDFVLGRDFDNLIVSCQVRSRLDDIVFTTTEADYLNFGTGQRKFIFAKRAGHYHASFVFPCPLLNSDTYELVVNLVNPQVELHDRVRGIFFEIVDSGSFASCLFNHRRSGIITIPIRWEITRE